MRKLAFELMVMQKRNQEGSQSTRAARHAVLKQTADILHDLGFRNMSSNSLKPKHVEALVQHWQRRELTAGTIKNRMAHLRWWAEKINKPGIIAKDNSTYEVQGRRYVTNTDKSRQLDSERMSKITDRHIRWSLKLQSAFGLRREESIKFIANFADRGDKIVLKSTWTKGGKERAIPIRNDEQRTLLDNVKQFAGRGSLIPPHKNYIQQLKTYERNVANAGFDRLHGLRHGYAQERYKELTGRECPIQGGLHRKDLVGELRELDEQARLIISKELGHERLEIVAVYIGS